MSVTQSCPTLCDPMDCSMPSLPEAPGLYFTKEKAGGLGVGPRATNGAALQTGACPSALASRCSVPHPGPRSPQHCLSSAHHGFLTPFPLLIIDNLLQVLEPKTPEPLHSPTPHLWCELKLEYQTTPDLTPEKPVCRSRSNS